MCSMDKVMNIMVILNTNYYKYFIVLMKSLFENHPQWRFHFYIVFHKLSAEAKNTLEKYASEHNGKCYFLQKEVRPFAGLKATSLYPRELYYKLIPHLALPAECEKALFLDIDMAVDGSLEDVYQMELPDDCLYVGCRGINAFRRHYLKGERDTVESNYINSGFMLMNLAQMRKRGITLEFYTAYLDKRDQILFEEELLNNALTHGEIRYLYPFDYNYNVGADRLYTEYASKNGLTMSKRVRHYMFFGSKKFGNYIKPWSLIFPGKTFGPENGEYGLFEENIMVWWKYARLTPFYQEFYETAVQSTNAYYEDRIKAMNGTVQAYKLLSEYHEQLLCDKQARFNANSYFSMNGIKRVGVIFSGAQLFKAIREILKESGVNLCFAVDKPKEFEPFADCEVDVVITANVYGSSGAFRELISAPVISMRDLLEGRSLQLNTQRHSKDNSSTPPPSDISFHLDAP